MQIHTSKFVSTAKTNCLINGSPPQSTRLWYQSSMNLFVSTFSVRTTKDIVMEVFVMDYDRFSKDDVMGKIVFGSKVKGQSQLGHWQDMISASPQMISQWHSI